MSAGFEVLTDRVKTSSGTSGSAMMNGIGAEVAPEPRLTGMIAEMVGGRTFGRTVQVAPCWMRAPGARTALVLGTMSKPAPLCTTPAGMVTVSPATVTCPVTGTGTMLSAAQPFVLRASKQATRKTTMFRDAPDRSCC